MTWIVSPKPQSVYVPNESDKRKFGLDISGYQGAVDFNTLKKYMWPKVDFITMRATISWGYKDAWFKTYWKSVKEIVGIPRALYAVLYPKESIIAQVKNVMEQMDGMIFDGDVVVPDLELDHGAGKAQISEAVYEFTNRLRDWAKKPIIIYSRLGWIFEFMDWKTSKYRTFIENEYWWFAQYLGTITDSSGNKRVKEDDRKILMPSYVSAEFKNIKFKTMIHQTGEKGAGKAFFGTQSEQIDTNRWLGTEQQFSEIWGQSSIEPEPITPTEPINISNELEAIRAELNKIELKVKQNQRS